MIRNLIGSDRAFMVWARWFIGEGYKADGTFGQGTIIRLCGFSIDISAKADILLCR
jgi:hypothetical protein